MYLSKQEKDLFGTTLVKIPTPSFIVFYNGNRKLPDVSYQKLSDAFEPTGSGEGFEWTAKVLNIGGEHNKELHKKCRALYDYTSYVNSLPYGKLTTSCVAGSRRQHIHSRPVRGVRRNVRVANV